MTKILIERKRSSSQIKNTAYVFFTFAFLFFGMMDKSWGQLKTMRNMDFMNVSTGKETHRPDPSGVSCTNPVTADAGPSDTSFCLDQSLQLNGVAGGDYTTVAWTTTGDGTFTPNAFSLNVVYHPGTFDRQDMTFTLRLTANANAPCVAASDEIDILLLGIPVTVTTSNSPVCENSSLNLGAGGGNQFFWTGPNGYTGYGMDTTIFPVALNQSGTYYVTVTNADGCSKLDSAVVLVKPVSGSIGNPIAACDSATLPWGETVTVTDDYSNVYTSFNGCDSIVTIHVTITYSSTIDTTVTACDSFTWYGIEYTTSGDKIHMFAGGNSQGCDSMIILHLTINVVDDGFACSIDACNTSTGEVTHDYSACTATLNVKAIIQGFYWVDRKMKPVLLNQGVPGATDNEVDTVTIELHDATNFSVIVDQYKGVIDTGGYVTGSPVIATLGTHYYIGFRHRNTIFTCSANPVFLNVVTNYDFTLNQDSTYGGNVAPDSYGFGKWVIYSGDVSLPFQDGYIGTDDVTNVDNDNMLQLYFDNADYFMLVTDISGDGYLGTDDVTITNNNNLLLIEALHP